MTLTQNCFHQLRFTLLIHLLPHKDHPLVISHYSFPTTPTLLRGRWQSPGNNTEFYSITFIDTHLQGLPTNLTSPPSDSKIASIFFVNTRGIYIHTHSTIRLLDTEEHYFHGMTHFLTQTQNVLFSPIQNASPIHHTNHQIVDSSDEHSILLLIKSSNHQIIPIATEGDMKLPVNTNNGAGRTDSYPLNNLSKRMRVYSIHQNTHTVLSSINTSLNIITISLLSSSLLKRSSFYISLQYNSLTSLPRNTPKYSTSFSISILTERFSAGGWLRDYVSF